MKLQTAATFISLAVLVLVGINAYYSIKDRKPKTCQCHESQPASN